ncbi:hypothetical protein [Leptolyngbya sp. 7M]|uniref:hypothetical protein n=1 Tax=Leptolyngbya sp. 7M TaxID=2812896 RepID=UPI001B8AF0D2|nr:hypothetical protein [Leptolyngbya sp. 7M]QYO62848.1 hypothetical protein JVX88_22905 [Leptolyngbya sp. 7M]
MTEQAKDVIAVNVAELMTRYSFDLGGYGLEQWIEQWLRQYPAEWLSPAVIEALYQGRYKAVSVWQILELWRRRGRPLQHFSREFERMISGRSLQLLFAEPRFTEPLLTIPQPVLVGAETNGSNSRYRSAVEPRQLVPQNLSVDTSALVFPARPSTYDSPPSETPPAIQPFRPSQQFQLSLPPEIRQPLVKAPSRTPIQRFVPVPKSPEIDDRLHDKLKGCAIKSPYLLGWGVIRR